MIDFLGLCRMLVNNYPLPSRAFKIKKSIDNYLLDYKLTRTQQHDVVKVLLITWKRNINKLRAENCEYLKNNISNF